MIVREQNINRQQGVPIVPPTRFQNPNPNPNPNPDPDPRTLTLHLTANLYENLRHKSGQKTGEKRWFSKKKSKRRFHISLVLVLKEPFSVPSKPNHGFRKAALFRPRRVTNSNLKAEFKLISNADRWIHIKFKCWIDSHSVSWHIS